MKSGYIYNVRDVASILKVSSKTVYGLIRDEQLKCIWVRGQIRITPEQLNEYLKGGGNGGKNSMRITLRKE